LQGHLQVDDQSRPLQALERRRRVALLPVGGGPHLRARRRDPAGSGAREPARPHPCRAQCAPLHRRLRRPPRQRGPRLSCGASRSLSRAGRKGQAQGEGRQVRDRIARLCRFRYGRPARLRRHGTDAARRMACACPGGDGMIAEYEKLDALGIAQLVRSRAVTSLEVTETAIALIEERNPALNAIVARLYDRAREAIAAGLPDGPFTGVPYLFKELVVSVLGAPTTYASRLFAQNMPAAESELVRRCRAAGLVVLGKTNSSEFGLMPVTEPHLFGPTRNPWNTEHTPGGSSGGSAAAVAAGMLPMAHATDGGGSIRIPASCCGLFGLKPTRGRITAGPEGGEGLAGLAAQ